MPGHSFQDVRRRISRISEDPSTFQSPERPVACPQHRSHSARLRLLHPACPACAPVRSSGRTRVRVRRACSRRCVRVQSACRCTLLYMYVFSQRGRSINEATAKRRRTAPFWTFQRSSSQVFGAGMVRAGPCRVTLIPLFYPFFSPPSSLFPCLPGLVSAPSQFRLRPSQRGCDNHG